ncbi:alpha-(1-_3)-arabinofuranosyltransferase [Actinomadura miaoliensis]|uniref:Alpha-(1->3)-arabinofuranosyltransferase n=1 Tax=Actinomadura miaoliensis TaxID=430685 RepID=A0ABP7WLG5_9ACTN
MAVGEVDASPSALPSAAGPSAEDAAARLRDRLRAAVCCLALTALAFSTRPGMILADTKIDMPVRPLGFLGRSLHLWDPEQFGQLQNQAVGYLFPMGPFYVLGDLAGMPAWITQRWWLSLLMCAAFLGVRKLAARLGVGTPGGRLLAGMAYALAPGAVAALGQLSSEYMPVAMLPWIVLPLVGAVRGGGRIRAAAWSGLAVACCGGINATATVAVLVVPVLYLLTRPRRAPRLRILAWWSAAVAAATAWWLVPLLLTGTYGFSWLTYTEKAATTTGPTGLVNVLRGAERWINYLIVDGTVWWPLGNGLALDPLPMVCTGVVAALGLAGLLGRLLPERTFLLVTLLTGLAILTLGHGGDLPGPFAAQFRDLLDGPLAPLRNLHKFDAVVRLPLALGLAHLPVMAAAVRRDPGAPPALRTRARTLLTAQTAAIVAVGGIGVTAVRHGLSGPGEFPDVPRYWRDAASWLNARAGQQAVLALPGSSFGEYLWGRPMDDIVQPLLSARWGVRQLVPAGSPGYTRALDAVDQQVRSGQGSPGLGRFLGRMGVRYVLVRNDLRRETLRGAWPARIRQTLDASPGLRRVAAFGPPVGGAVVDDAVSAHDQRIAPLEVYEVSGADAVAALADATGPPRVYGGPESLLAMADGGVLPHRPVLLDDDASDLRGPAVVSDSPRLLHRDFGELHHTSQTLTAAERARASDVLDDGWQRYATVAEYTGIRNVTASSSAAGADGVAQAHDPSAAPYAAVDGDPGTAWKTGGWNGPVGQWLQVDFERPREIGVLTAAFVRDDALGPAVTRVAVQTERGVLDQAVRPESAPQQLRVPPGTTRWVRLRVTGLASPPAFPALTRAAVAELSIDGLSIGRTYRLPNVPASTYVMSRIPGGAPGCMKGAQRWVCSDDLGVRDEEGGGFDRTFTAAAARRTRLSGTAVLTDRRLIRQYTISRGGPWVTATSVISGHPVAQPRSAFDGDPATTWIADPDDAAPAYVLRWRRPLRVSTITLRRPPGANGPVRVRVEGRGGHSRELVTDARGRLTFAPMTTDRLTLTFPRDGRLQPIQISEVQVPGLRALPDIRSSPLRLDCGLGPELRLGRATVRTRVEGTLGDVLEGRPLRFTACGQVALHPGDNRLTSVPRDAYRVETAVVGDGAVTAADAANRPVRVLEWSAGARRVQVDADRRSFLTVNENFNSGWRATVGGTELRPVRLDGWKQGWVVPAGTHGVVRLTYEPDRAQRVSVMGGLALLPVLLLLALWPSRRRRPEPGPLTAGLGWPAWAALASAAGLGGLISGLPGVAVALPVALVCGWARTRDAAYVRILASPWGAAVLMLAGTGSLVASVWPNVLGNPASPSGALGSLVPQLLGLAIVGRLAVELWRPGARRRTDDAIRLNWAAPDQRPPRSGRPPRDPEPSGPSEPSAEHPPADPTPAPPAEPDAPPGSGSPSPLRWTPPAEAEDQAEDRPGTPGRATRTNRR